jgi:hypothetical protein
MSTRCVITVIDQRHTFHIYRHANGYPTLLAGVLATLPEALRYAWPLPRYEAMDFAAALIRAWKKPGGGNIYFTTSYTAHSDLEFRYEVRQVRKRERCLLEVTTIQMTNSGWVTRGVTPLGCRHRR